MGNTNTGTVNGEWLKTALAALGENQASAAAKLGRSRTYFSKHINNRTYLKIESLRELALLFPTLNIRYVLTGQGGPLL